MTEDTRKDGNPSSLEEKKQAEGVSTCFNGKTEEADALWASLAANIPPPQTNSAPSGRTLNSTACENEKDKDADLLEKSEISEAPEGSGETPESAAVQESSPESSTVKAAPDIAEHQENASSDGAFHGADTKTRETESALPAAPESSSESGPASRKAEWEELEFTSATPDAETGDETLAAMAPGKTKKNAAAKVKKAGPFAGKSLGPVLPSLAVMVDEEGSTIPTPPTVASRIFSAFALIPMLLPLLLVIAQVAFTLDTRFLWYSDEVRYANAYQNMGTTADWFVLQLNGVTYPDKPPMFFWLLHGLKEVAAYFSAMIPFPVTENMIFFSGVAISGLLCLAATNLLASMVARVDRRTVLASNLILVGCLFFSGLLHYLRMDLLFAALITFSHIFLFHALVRDRSPFLMFFGFLLAGAAVLVKGPLGLAFPILAGICFAVWQGRFTRLFRLDYLFGLVVGLAVPAVWLGLAWMSAGDSFVDNILRKQVVARALTPWHHAEPWYHYFMTFPLIWLPWTLLVLFLPWNRFMGKGMRQGLTASRTKEAAGLAYLWCAFLPGFILLCAIGIKLPIYCLPLFPPLAVLCARAILRMRPFAAACLQYSLALLLAVLGICLVLSPVVPPSMLHIPYLPEGTVILGGICLVFACMAAFLFKPRRGEAAILVAALFTTAFAYPLWAITAPSLNDFLSPKGQSEVVKAYKDSGYEVAAYKIYDGIYAYYGRNVIDCDRFEEALSIAEANTKTALALKASFWDDLQNKPQGFVEVDRRIIAERAYVIVARPPLEGVGNRVSPIAPSATDGPENSGVVSGIDAAGSASDEQSGADRAERGGATPAREPQDPPGTEDAPEAVPDAVPGSAAEYPEQIPHASDAARDADQNREQEETQQDAGTNEPPLQE